MIDMVKNNTLYDVANKTLTTLQKSDEEGCLDIAMMRVLSQAVQNLRVEHGDAAIKMYKSLVVDDIGSVIVSAKTQAGKTGAIMAFCVLLYQQAEKGNFTEKYVLWFTGPADLALRAQTEERLFANDSITVKVLGSKCWHNGEFYRNGTEKQKLMREWTSHINMGYTMFIIADEAHIGIGTSQACTAYQKLPQLLIQLAGGIPGVQTHPKIKSLFVTATPYTFDEFIKNNPGADMREIWLQSGNGYLGLPDHLRNGRIRQHIKRSRGQTDADYRDKIQDLMEELDSEQYDNPGYMIFRVTTGKDRALFEEAASRAGIKCKVFLSSEGNIAEFQSLLEVAPDENAILIIVRSYKQGKTLCKDYIRAWYEADTKSKSGRNDADIYQSVGRNDGYNIANLNYPIFMCLEQAERIVKYIEAREANHPTPALSSTHTKTRTKVEKVMNRVEGSDPLDAMKKYNLATGQNLSPNRFNRITLSRITEEGRDIFKEYLTGAMRNTRPGKPNLIIFDKPLPNSQDFWDANPNLQGKACVQWDTGSRQEVTRVSKDTSMYNKK